MRINIQITFFLTFQSYHSTEGGYWAVFLKCFFSDGGPPLAGVPG